jgi:hypothetical protein
MTNFAYQLFATDNIEILLIAITILAAALAGWAYLSLIWRERYRTVKYLTSLLGEQYGFCRTLYQVNYDVRADGSAVITYEENLRILNADLPGIEHHTSIPSEPERIVGQFRITAQSKGTEVEISPKLILTTPTRLFYQLLFTPPLKPGANIRYAYRVDCPQGTFLDSEQALYQRSLPFDYISSKISYPTERFEISVSFPETWRIERMRSDVWMGDARLELRKEAQRVAEELEAEKNQNALFLRLRIAYPILGLKYVISWIPSKKVDQTST